MTEGWHRIWVTRTTSSGRPEVVHVGYLDNEQDALSAAEALKCLGVDVQVQPAEPPATKARFGVRVSVGRSGTLVVMPVLVLRPDMICSVIDPGTTVLKNAEGEVSVTLAVWREPEPISRWHALDAFKAAVPGRFRKPSPHARSSGDGREVAPMQVPAGMHSTLLNEDMLAIELKSPLRASSGRMVLAPANMEVPRLRQVAGIVDSGKDPVLIRAGSWVYVADDQPKWASTAGILIGEPCR